VRLQNQSYLSCFIRFSINQAEKTAAKKAKLFEAAGERSSLRQSKANDVSISLVGKIAVLKTI
jgi:hypothetical protein